MKHFFAVFLVACLPSAPKDQDEALHRIWASTHDSDTLALLSQWHAMAKGETLTGSTHGSITKLTRGEISDVAMDQMPDLSRARGFYYFGAIDCGLDQMEQIFYSTDQATLFPNTYDAFSREYTSDFDAYVARRVERVSWKTEFTDTVMDRTYDMTLHTELRFLGEALVARTFQPQAAVFHNAGDSEMDQDFHFDAYYPRADGKLMHVYAMWGRAQFGIFNTDSDLVVGVMIGNLETWDRVASDWCAKGYGRR